MPHDFDREKSVILGLSLHAAGTREIGLLPLSRTLKVLRGGPLLIGQADRPPPTPGALRSVRRRLESCQLLVFGEPDLASRIAPLIARTPDPHALAGQVRDIAPRAAELLGTPDGSVSLDTVAQRLAYPATLRVAAHSDIAQRLDVFHRVLLDLVNRHRGARRTRPHAAFGPAAPRPTSFTPPRHPLPPPDLPAVAFCHDWRTDPWTRAERDAVCTEYLRHGDLAQLSRRTGRSPNALRQVLIAEGVCTPRSKRPTQIEHEHQ